MKGKLMAGSVTFPVLPILQHSYSKKFPNTLRPRAVKIIEVSKTEA